MLALYFVAAWTIDAVWRMPSETVSSEALVSFSGATSYTAALAEVTGIGLRLASPCAEAAIHSGDDRWQTYLYAVGQEPSYADGSRLVVATTVLTPADWLERLWTLPGAISVDTSVVVNCPEISAGSPLGLLRAAPPAGQPTVLQFPAGVSYGDALQAASDLGLRLADPCYEAALAHGDHPVWHPANQQQAYATGRSLVVAPTILTPADWLSRLRSGVTPGPVLGCGSS
jgi:hypothetical protein